MKKNFKSYFFAAIIIIGIVFLVSIVAIKVSINIEGPDSGSNIQYLSILIYSIIIAIIALVAHHYVTNSTEKKIQNLNDGFERKVRERTQELIDAYYKIEKINGELANLDRSKSDFLLLINHEMRTPLNGIIGVTEALADTGVNEDQMELIEIMRSSNARLLRFVEASLLLTELKNEKAKTPLSEQNIFDLITDVVSEFQEQLQHKQINIKEKYCIGHTELNCNKNLVTKCLNLVLDNAIRFTPHNSTIEIRTYITVDSNYHIEINDQGPGFSEEALERLFKYFSSDNVMHHTEGLGLGLATVKLIMEIHRGTVTVNNRESSGASLDLSFPLLKAEESSTN